jgi:hypothetical protein
VARTGTAVYRWRTMPSVATRTYLAKYHMNVATEAGCKRFLARVDERMRRFGR